VYVFSYGKIKNLPDGIIQRDASTALLLTTHQVLRKKNRYVQQLADAGRFSAIKMDGAGGWAIDGDHTWLNQVPSLPLHEEPFFGHWASTMALHPCSQYAAYEKWT
jgi:hypothetical protein